MIGIILFWFFVLIFFVIANAEKIDLISVIKTNLVFLFVVFLLYNVGLALKNYSIEMFFKNNDNLFLFWVSGFSLNIILGAFLYEKKGYSLFFVLSFLSYFALPLLFLKKEKVKISFKNKQKTKIKM